FAELRLTQARDSLLELPRQHAFGVAGFALFQALAHANDGRESKLQRRLRAFENGLIGFAEILTPLAVADDGVGHTGGSEHGAGNLAREGAFLHPGNVLRADANTAAFDSFHGCAEVRKRRADHDLAVAGLLHQRTEFPE